MTTRESEVLTDQATLDAADFAFRHWSAPTNGTIRLGSDEHKTAFCRMLLDTHNPYKPAIIDWPKLDSDARERLVSLPIWDIAVQTEGKARLRAIVTATHTRADLERACDAMGEVGRRLGIVA